MIKQKGKNWNNIISKKTQKDSKRSKSLKKIEPSNKNKKKINETLYSVADYKPPIAKKTEKIEELKGNLEIPYSNTVINRQGMIKNIY